MMNGQAQRMDRERVNRVAKASGRSVDEIEAGRGEVSQLPAYKEFRENSGQHYPDFLEKEDRPVLKNVDVKIKKTRGLSDEAYREELDAQRKRAQALAYLAQTDDGVPDDCLRGEALARRKKQKRSTLSHDNTLQLVKDRKALQTEKDLQSKLLSVQHRLRNGILKTQPGPSPQPVPPPPPPPPSSSVPLPPGWRAAVHPSSRQTYYKNDATGETSATVPAFSGGGPRTTKTTAAPVSGQKKRRTVDPLDPTFGHGRDAVHHKGERMADSTAGGALWEQRPLPVPSAVLRMKGPGVRLEGSSAIGPGGPPRGRQPPPPPPARRGVHPTPNLFVPRHVQQKSPRPP